MKPRAFGSAAPREVVIDRNPSATRAWTAEPSKPTPEHPKAKAPSGPTAAELAARAERQRRRRRLKQHARRHRHVVQLAPRLPEVAQIVAELAADGAWPKGVHRHVAGTLGVSRAAAYAALRALRPRQPLTAP